ncbi:hypothetical protein [Tsuneonella deserti]|uniref:hypothetical protein n=1 Tax=Tsuneonella deserti TaxID=2035528 RepID=UPI00166481EB|nr:hypothetical protein [Tsuneonella deserti]
MNKLGCFISGVVWVIVFGFTALAAVMGDCPESFDECQNRSNTFSIVWWVLALSTLALMIWFFLLRTRKERDD